MKRQASRTSFLALRDDDSVDLPSFDHQMPAD
jgi:hypothetical protein